MATKDDHGNVMVGGESIHTVPASGYEAVYKTCSVSVDESCGGGRNVNGVPVSSLNNNYSRDVPHSLRGVPERLTTSYPSESQGRYSLWSLRQLLLGSPLFSCCRVGSTEANGRSNQSAIELQNLCDNDSPCRENDNVPGAGYIDNSSPDGPVWVMMDLKSFCPVAASEFLNASGDMKVKSLIVANSPLRSIVKLLDESLLTKNISTLKLENCSPTLEQIIVIIEKLTELQCLEISIKDACDNGKADPLMLQEFKKSCNGCEYFEKIRGRSKTSMGVHPQKLKVLKLTYPLIWQCTLISKAVDALMDWVELEELYIQTSPSAMLRFLHASENHINIENETSWQEFVTLDCRGLLIKSRISLSVISISCCDRFPLEYLRVLLTHKISANDIFRWCYFCTLGMIDSLMSSVEDGGSRCLLFPNLNSCEFHLPFVPVPQLREDEFRRPLHILLEFLAKNNHIQQQVVLTGLRPERGLEYWIKGSVVTIPRSGARIGTTYCSTTLGNNLRIYDDELYSMAFVIVPEEKRLRVSEIIEPFGKRVTYGNWRFDGVKILHIINEQPSLVSYGICSITSQFIGLTRLAVEDFTDNYKSIRDGRPGSVEGKQYVSLKDSDIQKILKYLTLLEYLHLDCNMSKVTDCGFDAGAPASVLVKWTQGNRCTLAMLRNLKYLFLRGFGPKLTDKFAMVAFEEKNCMPNLIELHVFGPGITNYGKDKIRNAFTDRKGFVLQL
ncbi:hypothetical protein Ocin01_13829 [Orchesella cincta]|uniref:Uncharacterized protein n=1 Tax=Orchesella cincta TaxID=48709 RepID=A0A1D2MJ90_ORCCI|nr:hypothetical protein Ocin01_13829 [Orchesella cincta]